MGTSTTGRDTTVTLRRLTRHSVPTVDGRDVSVSTTDDSDIFDNHSYVDYKLNIKEIKSEFKLTYREWGVSGQVISDVVLCCTYYCKT